MLSILKNTKIILPAAIAASMIFSSCNKALVSPPETTPTSSGLTIGETLAASASDSLFYKMVVRSGINLATTLSNKANKYTLFAVDNTGMKIFVNKASGGAIPLAAPDATFAAFISNTLPVASAAGIVNYLTIGQQTFTSGNILTSFPNQQLPTQIFLDPTNPLVRMTIFPSRRATAAWVNNIPVTSTDQACANGIIHHVFTVVAPPTTTLKGAIAAEPTLSYFRAAVARADSGQTGTSRIDSLLNYGVTNMTILAPNDAAFQAALTLLITQALIAQGLPPATAAAQAALLLSTYGPGIFSVPALYGSLTASTVRGILVYHILASQAFGAYTPNARAFSVNFGAAPAGNFAPTLVNTVFAAHPGVRCIATFTGPVVSSLQFVGLGTIPSGGAPYSGTPANAVSMDNHAVNGVYHIIDGVLLPQ